MSFNHANSPLFLYGLELIKLYNTVAEENILVAHAKRLLQVEK
jgi:hypothetical protein